MQIERLQKKMGMGNGRNSREKFHENLGNGLNKLKIGQYWGLWILLLLEIVFIVVLLMFSDKIYLQWNDNLDFNIAHAKMFRDNALWRDRQKPVPFLGGIDRSIFVSDYNLTSLLYYVFDPQFAYWACHGMALIFSGGGASF